MAQARAWYGSGMRTAIAVVLVATVAGCSGAPSDTEAGVICEQFVEQRVGDDTIEFDSQLTIETRGDLSWYVRSRFDAGDGVTVYECEVSHDGDETWTLDDLTTDRTIPD